ncbi:hypothetical protein GY45DRAFT_774452 [Cubamyces sp. BRFM 1775]|nr:hypothetical protein GY45DRAFT_774452 [Cubamyces sp. BRFM 1775]
MCEYPKQGRWGGSRTALNAPHQTRSTLHARTDGHIARFPAHAQNADSGTRGRPEEREGTESKEGIRWEVLGEARQASETPSSAAGLRSSQALRFAWTTGDVVVCQDSLPSLSLRALHRIRYSSSELAKSSRHPSLNRPRRPALERINPAERNANQRFASECLLQHKSRIQRSEDCRRYRAQ